MRNLPVFLLIFCTCVASAAEEGLASWYGGKFQGRPTASGEIYDAAQMTAAHKSLPFGTVVRVTNLENGRVVVVRINDRGPFVAGRIIDLSRAAALALGMAGSGVARVQVEPLEDYAPRNFYILQFGAFHAEGNARALAEKLRGWGYPALLEPADGGIVRVVMQDVPEEELEKLQKSLAAHGVGNYLVRHQRSELPDVPEVPVVPEVPEPQAATADSGS
jgi:rare lipoprotein A